MSPHREYAYIKRKQRTDSGPIPWQSVSWRYPWQFVSRCRCVSISSSIVLVLLADPECERKVRVSAPLRRLDATLFTLCRKLLPTSGYLSARRFHPCLTVSESAGRDCLEEVSNLQKATLSCDFVLRTALVQSCKGCILRIALRTKLRFSIFASIKKPLCCSNPSLVTSLASFS